MEMTPLFGLLMISVCTTTSLIFINKRLTNDYGFPCETFLTSYHFLVSSIVFYAMTRMNLFTADATVPDFVRLSTAAFGVGSIVFLNLNLKVNSIGFYQLSKLMHIPCMLVYKLVLKHKTTPLRSLLSLALLLVGLGLSTVKDVKFNIPGTIVAAIAVLSTTVYQSRSADMQSEYGISGPQLNEIVASAQFWLCAAAALLTETHGPRNILTHKFQAIEVGLILLTGLLAAYGNVIGFIVIGRTGPVTFQVIGHAQTIFGSLFGLVLFPPNSAQSRAQETKETCGLVMSMVGFILHIYFELKIREQENIDATRRHINQNHGPDQVLADRAPGAVFPPGHGNNE